jgi:amino acid transporter
VGLILLCLVLALGGGPNHDRTGFRYWNDPGAFNPYILSKIPCTSENTFLIYIWPAGSAGNFLAVWSSFLTALFAFLGTELIGVTVGEAQNPRKTIPRAIKLTFARIVFFYVIAVFFLGMIVPFNSPALIFANSASSSGVTTASASPFVVAIQLAGINVLPGFFNGCILLFVFSAANSGK